MLRTVLTLAALVAAGAAQAASYSFAPLAESDGFAFYGPPVLNNNGAAAFNVSLNNGSDAIVRAESLTERVTIANDARRFSRFGDPAINDAGAVAFEASLERITGEGIFRGNGGTAQQLAGTRDAGDFDFVRAGASINILSSVAFSGERIVGGDFFDGVYVANLGQIRTVYDTRSAVFTDFSGLPAINDHGMVAFLANRANGSSGLYTGNGGPVTTVADDSGLLVGALSWSDPSLNDHGDIAFSAGTNEDFGDNGAATGRGVFVWRAGVLETIVQGGFEQFFDLGDVSLNNAGKVAFVMEPSFGQQILVTGADPVADRVVATGDQLFGRTVTALLFSREGLNDKGQLAFTAFFADGGAAVVLATPLP